MAIDVSAWPGVRVDELVTGGHRNEVWSGRATTGRVAIRRSRRSAASLAWELDLLEDLDAAGFLVPRPLRTIGGERTVDGVVVQEWIEGAEPTSADDWLLVAAELRRLHAGFAGRAQRPGCRTVLELDTATRSVDADLAALPTDVAREVLDVLSSMSDVAVSVVHGDPGPTNLRITADGRVGLLDWDESRVDVVDLDLADLGVQVLDDDAHERARRSADAWEVANAWTAEPDYARRRLAALRARQAAPHASLAGVEVASGEPLPPIELDGARHRLRPFGHDDLALIREASDDELIPSITTVPKEWTPSAGRAFIERQQQRLDTGVGWSLAIAETATDRAIGQVGLWISQLARGRAELGYWVVASARGRGAASDALETLSDWAFEHLDVDRLGLYIEPWNAASIRTAERAGYEREGLLRRWERVDGVSRDMWSYVRLRDRGPVDLSH